MPPLSIQAIEPPPAPIVRMSIIGIWIGTPHSISKAVVKRSLPPIMVEHVGRGAAHVERHEMVDAGELGHVAAARSRRRSGRSTRCGSGALAAASSVISPPFDLMTTAGAVKPRLVEPPAHRAAAAG